MLKDLLIKLFARFFPKERAKSPYMINYKSYYQAGFRAIIMDIDNTLVPHGAQADERTIELFDKLHNMGFKTCLISNNKKKRVAPFAKAVNSSFTCKAGKPEPGNYIRAAKHMGVRINEVLFIGDQLFTDIWGANRAGMYSILVEKIAPQEEIQIVLKRYLEAPVLKAYEYVKK